ncbi:hypothetical protein BAA08_04540 [Bizionia sp. APA-3]|nr:hypothetical protein BAA08_04540 [Bizionia sp. APA-3]|tara:strand:- start:254 stop:433 length:180 start_codon:yes stop_codon:yes gene_type:complete
MDFGNVHTKIGFLGGTLFSIALNISLDAILFTVVMASIGASVSYLVAKLLNYIFSFFKK